LGLVLAAVGALGVGLLSYTWIHLEVLSTGYKIDKLETQLREMTRTERQLSLEAAYLASPQMIEERARRDLGLEPPTLSRVIFWEELP
ncbi:MAG TPA: septum formation initiator family protein, partial [Thermoanaerobaculia bacterium]|nr:septum formation initiator family protein [Thermoanaerobaculia bacterium]